MRRLRLVRSAGIDRRIVTDVARAVRRLRDPRPRLGITYPLRESAVEDRRLARELAAAFDSIGWDALLLPTVGHELRPKRPLVDVLLMLAPVLGELPQDILRILWIRSSVAAWPRQLLEAADITLAASNPLADEIAALTGLTPILTPPAVAPEPAESRANEIEISYIGDATRFADRLARYFDQAPPPALRVFGDGWNNDPRFRNNAGVMRPGHTAPIHRRSRIVLGLRDGRRRSLDPELLRAALRGALPVTDDVESAASLGPLLPTFVDSHELGDAIDSLRDESGRIEAVERLATTVAAEHTVARRTHQIAAHIEREQAKLRIALMICPPNRDVMERWGDTHLARHLARAMRRRGFRSAVRIRSEWDVAPAEHDVVVHVRGLEPYRPRPEHVNLLWIISHPETVTAEECDQYDAVLVASSRFAGILAGQVRVPVHTMHQATDPSVFRFGPRVAALRSDVLFVGNARLPVRQVPRWLLELDAPLTIYGTRWDELAERRYVRGDFVPNEHLHALYRSADVVVNDHWPDMRAHGFVSNRVFDVLACGGFVVSDHVDSIPSLFADAVPTFRDKDELAGVLATFADDPAARMERALEGRSIVLEQHTFDVRAEQIAALIEDLSTG